MLETGTIIDGKYKILNIIGHGGMSTVYLAINEKANKPWAIKEVRKDGVKNFEIVRQSLMVETDMLKKLSHKGLPSIVDVIDEGDNFLIVMDYIEGMTLKAVLTERGTQAQEDVVDWALQICDVLKYLHSRQPPIIYRDMKPSNIMLRSDGSVMLIDFGTAREFKERNLADTTCLGTQGYAAPEQFGGRGQTDARTDIYSLGATMYHLVTGHNPSEPPYEIYPITRWKADLSTGLEHIISKCTQRNPQDRFQSAEELIYALKHYKDLDISAFSKYKRKIRLFSATVLTGLCFMTASLITGLKANMKQVSEYGYLISVADKSATTEDALGYYQKAIAMDCTKGEAYQGIVECFGEDGIFSEAEEEILVKLNISVDKYLVRFASENPQEYADFCYNVGNLYWFYYVHEGNRQSNAVNWFQTAMEYYENNKDKNTEWKRSRLYVEIGTFYKKILLAQIEGTDTGMYSEYWNNLMELKQFNDENPDGEMTTLRLYREIVSRTAEYAGYLMEDGVTQKEIETLLQAIRKDMQEMEKGAGSSIRQEISEINVLLEDAENMVASGSSKTEHTDSEEGGDG